MKEALFVLFLMGLAFAMAWYIDSDNRLDRALVGPLRAQVVVLLAEARELEERLDKMPDCFQLRGGD